jgi:hypothetical protein
MKTVLKLAALVALAAGPTMVSAPAFARDHHDDRDYRGRGGSYHHKCGGGNGAVGTIAGGAGGALAGNALGGGTLGTVAGGVGGALIGRHFDKQNTRHKNGC